MIGVRLVKTGSLLFEALDRVDASRGAHLQIGRLLPETRLAPFHRAQRLRVVVGQYALVVICDGVLELSFLRDQLDLIVDAREVRRGGLHRHVGRQHSEFDRFPS